MSNEKITISEGEILPTMITDQDGKLWKLQKIISRVQPPPSRGGRLCERHELLESLDESLENRVTLVIAPAGYGKTTLLSQWCQMNLASQIPTAYYSASEQDRDPSTFLAMIATALNQAGIDINERSTLNGNGVHEDVALEDILLGLELAGQPLALVIDDFERVNEPAITNTLQQFIECAPTSLHFVIASRTFPNIPLSAIELEGKLRLIDSNQLRLNRTELAWLLDLDPNNAEVQDVAVQTQGWPVIVELYRLWRLRRGVHDEQAKFGGHVAEMQNYLTEQLFAGLPKEQFDLLVDISNFTQVSTELADAIRNRDDSSSLLSELSYNMSSLMWTGREYGTKIYRLHPLLLEHLRERHTQASKRRAELTTRAAHWFASQNRYPEAIGTAIESRSADTIKQIVQQLRPMKILVAEGATTLRMILRELPDEVIKAHPNLQIMVAAAHFKAGLFTHSKAIITRVRETTDNFSVDPDGHPERLRIEGNFINLIVLCQVSRCGPEVRDLHDIVREAAAHDPLMWGACEIVTMLVQQIHGNFEAAEAAIARARDIYRTIEHTRYSADQINGHEIMILVARGKLRHAMEVIAGYKTESDFEWPHDAATPTLFKLVLASIRYEREYSDNAVEKLKKSLIEHRKTESWFDQYAIAYPSIANRLYVKGGAQAALDYIQQEKSYATDSEIEALPDFLIFLDIEFRARAGDVDGAQQQADIIDLKACAFGTDRIASLRGWREREGALYAHIRLKCELAYKVDPPLAFKIALPASENRAN